MSELDEQLDALYMQVFGWVNPYIFTLLLLGMILLLFILGIWLRAILWDDCGVHVIGAAGTLTVCNVLRILAFDERGMADRAVMAIGCLVAGTLLSLAAHEPDGKQFVKPLAMMASSQFLVATAFVAFAIMVVIADKQELQTEWLALRLAAPALLLLATFVTGSGLIAILVIRAHRRRRLAR